MLSVDVRLVIGTRPEAIKMAPVAHALSSRGIAPIILLTGQQRIDAREFGLQDYPRLSLDCAGQSDPYVHVQQLVAALAPHFSRSPDLVIVQGDTSSALGGFLAAQMAGVSVAHVEAGLRTHDPRQPWPEEEYRVAIDAGAELLFAPTPLAVANLKQEGVQGRIALTGNTGIDALLKAMPKRPPKRPSGDGNRTLLVTCHRRENWAGGLSDVAAALIELSTDRGVHVDVLLHPNAFVAARMTAALQGHAGIRLLPPCTHAQLLHRMCDADLLLSDSGGMQEEAPALGAPLLILRNVTERPEAVACGNAILVGTDRARIVVEARRLLEKPGALASMAAPAFPFGDGHAATRIAEAIERWLGERAAAADQPAVRRHAN